MNYNINDILPFVKNFDFPEYFSSQEEDFLVSSIEDGEEYDWEDGATKLVIIPENLDYVIKIPFNAIWDSFMTEYIYMSQDYCNTEMELYYKIEKENPLFTQFLLPLTYVKEFSTYDIYIQPKCQSYINTSKKYREKTYSKKSLGKISSCRPELDTSLPNDWLAAVAEELGDVELVKEFLNLLEKYDMTQDLHHGNIGYCNGKPIILDYGSFYDSY